MSRSNYVALLCVLLAVCLGGCYGCMSSDWWAGTQANGWPTRHALMGMAAVAGVYYCMQRIAENVR